MPKKMSKKETDVLCKIICSRCGKDGFVPFVADGSRNYYCADCLAEFNIDKKKGLLKEFTDTKGRSRYEFVCTRCGKLKRGGNAPTKISGQLICAECTEKEKRTQRTTDRKRVVIGRK